MFHYTFCRSFGRRSILPETSNTDWPSFSVGVNTSFPTCFSNAVRAARNIFAVQRAPQIEHVIESKAAYVFRGHGQVEGFVRLDLPGKRGYLRFKALQMVEQAFQIASVRDGGGNALCRAFDFFPLFFPSRPRPMHSPRAPFL